MNTVWTTTRSCLMRGDMHVRRHEHDFEPGFGSLTSNRPSRGMVYMEPEQLSL